MKQKIWLLPLLSLVLVACNDPLPSDKLKVYTSFFVMEDFAKKIGGNYVEVANIVPAGGEIHAYEPTTGDIINLSQADMFVYNGAGLEHFVDHLQNTVANPDLVYVETTAGLELLVNDEEEDPHTWLSPLNAKKQMENIKNALVSTDPDHSQYYENRYQLFANKFNDLHEQFVTFLASGFGQYLVSGHAAFGYITNAYDLIALPINGYDSEQEPTQQDIANVIDIVNANDIQYVYAESLTPSDAVLTVVGETNAELAYLNTLESLTNEQKITGEDYFSVMKDNLYSIAKGFIES